jgi:hypothetical protein
MRRKKNMPKDDIINAILSRGGAVLLGEFRGGKAERINYTDKKTGKAAHFNRVANSFEVGPAAEQVRVTERLADNVDVDKHTVPYKKGQHFAIEVEGITIDKGSRTVSASALHALS